MKEPFTLSRKQRMAYLFLACILLVEWITYVSMPRIIHPKKEPLNEQVWQNLVASLEAERREGSSSPIKPLTPFRFNPNLLDKEGFLKLGLSEKLATTILHYREKGGRFYKKESFKKMWGLREEEYIQLEPFIDIPQENRWPEKEKLYVDVNHCDTTALIALPGIGSWMANQIIQYREKLGGFIHKQQVKEVYGFRAELWPKIQDQIWVKKKPVKKINLNNATLSEMNKHPYLQGEIALAIVNYRKEHDYTISALEDLKKIPLINEELFRKIAPYTSLQ